MTKTAIATLAALMASTGFTTRSEQVAQPEERDELTRALADALEADNGSGVQAAAVRDGRVIWRATAGHADLENRIPMRHDHRLRIGSVSKPLTAALAARLAALGSLDLERPLDDAHWPASHAPVTPYMLGSHTSGIRHVDFSNFEEANNQRYFDSLSEALPRFISDPLEHEPGSRFSYSSYGYDLLGVVAGDAAGGGYDDALTQYILAPLQLADTLPDYPRRLVERRGRFYTLHPDRTVINTIWRDSSDYYPSGGMLSTAQDLARFTWEVFAGPTFSQAERDLFTRPATLREGKSSPWTFGWERRATDDGDVAWLGHGGLTNGATAEVRWLPAPGIALAVIANYNFWFDDTPTVITTVMERADA